MNIAIQKLTPTALIPTRAHPDDAGLDLYASESVELVAGVPAAVATGVALAIPSGYVGLIWDKSGLAIRFGLKTLGGVIDASYRGEIRVVVVNLGLETYRVEAGTKIAQLLVQKIELPVLTEVSALDETARGEGGFGSTGAR